MPQNWYIKTRAGQVGPYRWEVVSRLARQGKLSPRNLISLDSEKWFRAGRVKQLVFSVAESSQRVTRADVAVESTSWYVMTKSVVGPLSYEQLVKLAGSGRLHPNVGVSQDKKRWVRAKEVSGLRFPPKQRWQDSTNKQPILGSQPSSVYAKSEGPAVQLLLAGLQSTFLDRIKFGTEPEIERVVPGPLKCRVPSDETYPLFEFARDADNTRRNPLGFGEPSGGGVVEPISQIQESTSQSSRLIARWDGDDQLAKAAEARERLYSEHFGNCHDTIRGRSDASPIQVHVYGPRPERPFTTLVTSGMSDCRPSVCSDLHSGFELVLYADRMHPRDVEVLLDLARYPQTSQRLVTYGSTIERPGPLDEGSELDGFVMMVSPIDSKWRIDGDSEPSPAVPQLMWPVATSVSEREFLATYGMQEFCDLLDRYCHPLFHSAGRPCYHSLLTMPAFS